MHKVSIRRFAVIATALLSPTLVLASPAAPAKDGPNAPLHTEGPFARGVPEARIPGQALVRLRDFDEDALNKLASHAELREEHARVLREIATESGVRLALVAPMHFGWALYDISNNATATVRPDEEETQRLIRALARDKAVAAAAENGWRRALRVPNDTFYSQMWNLQAIRAPAAWDITTGTAQQRIGVIDSGTVRDHYDLSTKDVAGYDFISDAFAAGDGNGRDSDYSDPGTYGTCESSPSFHGTHVAGTILAEGNDSFGIPGVNWNASLVTARALGECGGTDYDILESVVWLAGYAVNGVPNLPGGAVRVINMSLGSSAPCHEAYHEYFDFVVAEKDIVLVAATGNDGNHVPVGVPANCPQTIAVAAHGVGANRPLTSYSNFGANVDVVAPGGTMEYLGDPNGVLSTVGPEPNLYDSYEGTSMASPHVAGIASLMLAVNPSLSAAQVKNILKSTGDSCAGCGNARAVRADLAVQTAQSTPGTGGGSGGNGGVAGGPCSSSGDCPAGHTCLWDNLDNAYCFKDCSSPAQCPSGTQCLPIDDTLASCIPAGNRGEGASCADDPDSCKVGTRCLTISAGDFCFARCDMGYTCASHQQCIRSGYLAYCDPIGGGNGGGGNNGNDDGGNGGGGGSGGGEGGGGGGGGSGTRCDLRRGNWDCPNRYGCVDDRNGDNFGVCERGAEGRTDSGGLCDDDEDCSSGLCDRGVCTVPCDEGRCRDGYECDKDAIPGGLCRAESCQASEGAICADGWYCTYSKARRYVCAKEGEPAFGSVCACAEVPSRAPWALLLGLLVPALFFRRRGGGLRSRA